MSAWMSVCKANLIEHDQGHAVDHLLSAVSFVATY